VSVCQVWAAAHTGTIVVRDMMTGEQIETIDTERFMVWCMAVVGKRVWAGTEDGPILIYDGATQCQCGPLVVFFPECSSSRLIGCAAHRKLVGEARQHMGGMYCLATDKAAGAAGRSMMWSGSNDFTCNMWMGEGEFVKLYSGHSGSVRCVLGAGTPISRRLKVASATP
jgi:WD40 repeat protein